MNRRAAAIAAAFASVLLCAPAPAAQPLDSQLVLDRYAVRLNAVKSPDVMIFTYAVSQAGPHNIEQTHRIYRRGNLVRDETLAVDGEALSQKITRIARYRNHYTVETLAPRSSEYAFLFLRAQRSGSAYRYLYRAVALGSTGPFVVQTLTIDGRTYLPAEIRFRTSSGTLAGTGSIAFSRAQRFWVPTLVTVNASVNGRSARERITFSAYRFPASLPKSTFQLPKPLPKPTLPAF